MISEDDQDVFEITDFTTVSDWERFIAQLEEIIHEWKLPSVPKKPDLTKEEIASGTWQKQSEVLNFVNFNFLITRYQLKQDEDSTLDNNQDDDEENESLPMALSDMMCCDFDFVPKGPHLAQWYGIRDFVTVRAHVEDIVNSETRAKLLLSSTTVAVNNTNCQIPMFVQVNHKNQEFYLGICEAPNIRTNYEMVHLRRIPPKYNHLAGLMDVFKSKIALPSKLNPLDVKVSIKFTYVLDDWSTYSWSQSPPDMELYMGEVGVKKLGALPYGAYEDPICKLHLNTVWTSLPEKHVSDNSVFSVLDPLQAPEWIAKLTMKPNLQCLLYEYLSDFKSLCGRKETSASLLGHEIEKADTVQNAKITQALDKLTEPVNLPTISSVVSRAKMRVRANQEKDKTPIPTELLIKILQFIFPDSATTSMNETVDDIFNDMEDMIENNELQHFLQQMNALKSAPASSLTMRLGLAMCHINHSYGGLNGVAHMWQEFVLEMRYRWENHYTLPCIENGMPNFRYCLLHQKLQMLNCCITRKKIREEPEKSESTPTSQISVDEVSSISSSDYDDEEFFECSDNVNERGTQIGKPSSDLDSSSDVQIQPEGRLRKCGDLMLLNYNSSLYIPVTQEPAPMTEDLLEEQARVLIELGTDQEGAQLRAKMQSTCLLSDMESFKAANPNATIEDFVRWYSPRDWIEEEAVNEFTGETSVRGQLSARMLIPGNMWIDVWSNAKAVPARKQKRLFDDTKEAEKVLHYLSSLTPAQVAIQLFPIIIHASLITIMKNCDIQLSSITSLLEITINKAIKVTRAPCPELKMFEEIIDMIGTLETLIAQVKSVKTKFALSNCNFEKKYKDADQVEFDEVVSDHSLEDGDINLFVSDILDGKEVKILGTGTSTIGRAITKLFVDSTQLVERTFSEGPVHESTTSSKFPAPSHREYILRTYAQRPAAYSSPTPQRMHCILNNDNFRIAGAFSEDTLFQ